MLDLTTHLRTILVASITLVLWTACSSTESIGQSDSGAGLDVNTDRGTTPDKTLPSEAGSPDRGSLADAPPVDVTHTADTKTPAADTKLPADLSSSPLPRGLKWVRNNPMFISGQMVSMGAPSATAVSDYFQGLKANALHLWEDGLPNELNGWRKHAGATMRFVSWVNKNGTSNTGGKVIGGLAANTPGRIGFQIGDEPATMTHFNEMLAGAKKVRLADPGALIIFNWTYKLIPYLDQALAQAGSSEMDVYSYDVYTYTNGTFEHLERYRAVGLKYKRPYWRYINCYLSSTSSKDAISESATQVHDPGHLHQRLLSVHGVLRQDPGLR